MRSPIDSDKRPVLVTGATGFLGRPIVQELLREGRRVVGVCRRPPAGAGEGEAAAFHLRICDLSDRKAVSALIRSVQPSACVHAAWEVTPESYLNSPANDRWLSSSAHLAEELARHHCKWLGVLGTCFEKALPCERIHRTLYVQAKRVLHQRLEELREEAKSPSICWFRVHQPFGPGEREERLLPRLISACRHGGEVTVRNGAAVRDFIHVDDIAEAVSAALAGEIEGAFDVGTGRGRRIDSVVQLVAERLEGKATVEIQGTGETGDGFVADPKPLRAACDWQAVRSLEEWLDDVAVNGAPGAEGRAGPSMLMRTVAFVGEPQKVARPRCPICGVCDLKTILTAADQPALLNRGYRTPAAAKCAARACLDFRGCQQCGFAFNASFDGDLASYGPGYVNDQSCSPAFYDHLMDALGRMKEMIAGRCGQVVEVGCGQGSFLRFLCEATHRTGIGFDPACEIPFPPDLDAERAVRLKPFLFTSDDAEDLADDEEEVALIVCRHVLEHLPDPVGMLRLLRQVSAAHDAPICLEIPDWKWISDHDAFFEFFHEHCSLFDRDSMSMALAAAGLRPLRMESGFADQFLLVEAMSTADPSPTPPSGKNHDAAEMPRLDGAASCDFDDAAVRMDAAAQRTRQFLNEARKEGPVILWGAGAKAVSVLNHLRLDGRAIQAVVDVNPAKHHHFLPLTGHRVIPPRELPALIGSRRGRPTIVVMNPCYADEIAQCIERLGVKASLHTLTDLAREPVHG